MNNNFAKIMELSQKMNRFEMVLRMKCEICGPKLKGWPGNYPEKCPKHD